MGSAQVKEAIKLNEGKLALRELGLSKFPYNDIKRKVAITDVKEMNLSDNEITSLPPTISSFTNLTVLNMMCNNLKSIPDAICDCINLNVVILSFNHITAIPENIGNLQKLKTLTLYDNCVRTIPESIWTIPDLNQVLIDGNYIDIEKYDGDQLMKLAGANSQYLPTKILDKLYLGSVRSAEKKEEMQNIGITHVLTVGNGLKPKFPDDFEYKIIRIDDIETADIEQHLTDCCEFMENAMKSGTVLVHCAAGVSRSGSVVIAYVMKHKGLSAKDALAFVREKRGVVCPNDGFLKQLDKYEDFLAKE